MGDRQQSKELVTTRVVTPLARKLMRLSIMGRWFIVGNLWLFLGSFSFWRLRKEFHLWQEHFTWSAVRLSLSYHFWASLGLIICIGYTCAVLLWHSQKIIHGWSSQECYRFNQRAKKLSLEPHHWLWPLLNRI